MNYPISICSYNIVFLPKIFTDAKWSNKKRLNLKNDKGLRILVQQVPKLSEPSANTHDEKKETGKRYGVLILLLYIEISTKMYTPFKIRFS